MNYSSVPNVLLKAFRFRKTPAAVRSVSLTTAPIHGTSLNRNLVRSHHPYPHPTHSNSRATASRTFSSSSIQEWKSIGSAKKNRKTRCKLKTHQGAAKRFFVTGRGQFKRVQAGTQHLMTGVRNERKRRLKPMIIVNKSHSTLLRKLLPYAGKRAGFRKLDQSETVWWKSGKLQKTGYALQSAIQRAQRLQRQNSTVHSISPSSPPPNSP